MKIYIASDHGGFYLKEHLKKYLIEEKYDVKDLGTSNENSVDYPDFARKLCDKVKRGRSRGILICGTGIGMSIAANKVKGIRAAVCFNEYTARMSRIDNNANVICFGGRVIGPGLAVSVLGTWLKTKFTRAKRHLRRVSKINMLEK